VNSLDTTGSTKTNTINVLSTIQMPHEICLDNLLLTMTLTEQLHVTTVV